MAQYAVRSQSQTISIKPGAGQTYRLPAMTPGTIVSETSRVTLPTGADKPGHSPGDGTGRSRAHGSGFENGGAGVTAGGGSVRTTGTP